ncbi:MULTISPECIES: DsbA family protein [Kribbella]|uniref:Thioredoxin domain-containing protein n=1 Tax=Kribbella karoonensis TaxID=324851 RepID=A0ABP4PZE2_9ACTN
MAGKESRRATYLRWAPVAAIALAGAVLVGVSIQGGGDKPEAAPASQATPADPAKAEDPGLAHRKAGDPLALGKPDAPVAIVEYADFRCPFCAQFTRETLPALVKEYVDKGLVRYEFRDLPLFGEESWQGAIAGRAAARQGKFWEYLAAVHKAAPAHGHPPLPRAKLIAFARQAGVPDQARFERDLADKSLRTAVQSDAELAQQFGLNTVPFFAIDNVAVSGAQPVSVFQQVIEQRLKAHNVR